MTDLTLREIRYKEKKRKILKKAANLFAKKGYEKATIEEIAAGLKLNKASLYHYVGSKEELLYRIQVQALDQTNEALDRVLESELDSVEKLREILRSHVEIATKEPVIQTLRQQEFILPPKWRDKVIAKRNRFERGFMRLIQDSVEHGAFDNKDWKVPARAILGAMYWIPWWYSRNGEFTPEEISDAMTTFIVRGLFPK